MVHHPAKNVLLYSTYYETAIQCTIEHNKVKRTQTKQKVYATIALQQQHNSTSYMKVNYCYNLQITTLCHPIVCMQLNH